MRFRMVMEAPDAPRQRWCFTGRQTLYGKVMYRWDRYTEVPDEDGYIHHAFCVPPEDFWPGVSSDDD